MHLRTIVIHDDDEDPVQLARAADPSVDWAAIGGRYTGSLYGKDGRVSGDAVPDFEANMSAALSSDDVGWSRPGAVQRDGFDQVRKRDIDFDYPEHLSQVALAVTADLVVNIEDFRDEDARSTELEDGPQFPRPVTPEMVSAMMQYVFSAGVDMHAYQHALSDLYEAADEDSWFTVVDVHV